jgi:hypothetical protein
VQRTEVAIAIALSLVACGDKFVYRPLEVDIDGVSSDAQKLILKAFPGSSGQTCAGVGLSTVEGLTTPYVSTWTRGVDADRKLSLPKINDATVTVVVYTENMDGTAIQFVCSSVSYPDIETGIITIRLNTQPMSLLYSAPWRRSSDRSGSSDCSGAAGWRRCSSRTG